MKISLVSLWALETSLFQWRRLISPHHSSSSFSILLPSLATAFFLLRFYLPSTQMYPFSTTLRIYLSALQHSPSCLCRLAWYFSNTTTRNLKHVLIVYVYMYTVECLVSESRETPANSFLIDRDTLWDCPLLNFRSAIYS